MLFMLLSFYRQMLLDTVLSILEERMRYAYAWKTLREFHPAMGTDAPIEDVNPFKTIAAALNRHKY